MTPRRVRDIEYQLLPGSQRKTTDIVIERNGQQFGLAAQLKD